MASSISPEGSLLERMKKRDKERKSMIEKRVEERQNLIVETQQLSYFSNIFYSRCKTIKDWLDSIETVTDRTTIRGIFDNINNEITTLKTYLYDSKFFLRAYDIRRAQDTLQILENDVTQCESKCLPKLKFGFRNHICSNNSSVISSDVTDDLKDLKIAENIATNGISKQYNKNVDNRYGDNTNMLLGKVDEKFVLDAENVNKNDVLLSDLTRCTVRIYGTPNTVHMISLVQCTILIGPVSTSIIVDKCGDCDFAFACQQLRLHSSTNCTVYLHITSRAIIEDSKQISFAPYNWTYEDQMNHFKLAGLNPKINNWNIIDDFNWLSKKKSSPNWSILEPEKRLKSWD